MEYRRGVEIAPVDPYVKGARASSKGREGVEIAASYLTEQRNCSVLTLFSLVCYCDDVI